MGAGFNFKRKQRSEVYSGMNKITLHRDDLETILKLVDQLNPNNTIDGDRVTITADSSSGIGVVIAVEVPVDINGVTGTFNKVIVDSNKW